MREVIQVKADNIFSLIIELIEMGQSSKISVSGNSMVPLLRDSIDSVELSKGTFDSIKRGDIVMIRRLDGAYIMHRVLRKNENNFFIVGDAQQWIEGPLRPEQIVAVVKTVWRGNKKISCDNLGWRFLCGLWLLLLPFRDKIFKVFGKLNRLTKILSHSKIAPK